MGPRDWRRAQLIYKILSAIKVPLAEEPCRLVGAVKQVLRSTAQWAKVSPGNLAALLSFMPLPLPCLAQRNIVTALTGGGKGEKA